MRIQKVGEEVGRLLDLVAAEVNRQPKDKGTADSTRWQHERGVWVPTSRMFRGRATFGDPASQATAGEIHTLWEQLQKKLPKDALDLLSLVRPAVANHHLLLRFRGAPSRTDAALDMARRLRDAMDTALMGVTLKDKPLRAGLEISPDRKDRLSKSFRAHDSLLQHWKDLGLEAKLTPCVATLRLHGLGMHVLGSLGRSDA